MTTLASSSKRGDMECLNLDEIDYDPLDTVEYSDCSDFEEFNDARSDAACSTTIRDDAEHRHRCWDDDDDDHPSTDDDTPQSLRLYRMENVAIPLSYLVLGLLQGLSGPFNNVYPLDVGATEAQQTTVISLRFLPASCTLAFGFLSDGMPMCGYRRKSYMLLAWFLTSFSMVVLLLFSDLSAVARDENGDRVVPENAPSIPFLSAAFLLYGTGYYLANTMVDSVVAEKAKREPESSRGQLQTTCYALLFFGLMVGAPCSTLLYDRAGPAVIVSALALLPLLVVPAVYALAEKRNVPVRSTREQCRELWTTVCSRAVWQPLGFVFVFNLLQVNNAAWKQYLRTVRDFSAARLNALYIVATVLLYVGVMVYKYCFLGWSWRTVYLITALLNGLFSTLQLLLIINVTLGLDPLWFAMGDEAMTEFTQGMQFVPVTIMMVNLCPSGSEGASYALFNSVLNSAQNVSFAVSTLLLGIWDVSETALFEGRLSGIAQLTVLTTLLQTSGVLLVGLLPRTRAELMAMHGSDDDVGRGGSRLGGAVFLTVIFSSVLYSVFVCVMNTIAPGWMGGS